MGENVLLDGPCPSLELTEKNYICDVIEGICRCKM